MCDSGGVTRAEVLSSTEIPLNTTDESIAACHQVTQGIHIIMRQLIRSAAGGVCHVKPPNGRVGGG